MYRGTHCDAPNPGEMFALEVKKAIDEAHANDRKVKIMSHLHNAVMMHTSLSAQFSLFQNLWKINFL